jgi:hypothetical protein
MRGSRFRLFLGLFLFLASDPLRAQTAPGETGTGGTLRVSTNLVLVNVVPLGGEGQIAVPALTRDDFVLFDNNRPVPIRTFDAGSQTRPLAVWLLVQCPMPEWEDKGSALFRGHTGQFQPVFTRGRGSDTFGVAHWCDDGTSHLDLFPTADADESLAAVERVLSRSISPGSHDRSGELALQAALQKIVEATQSRVPERVPVVIFLYDDYSAMPRGEADHFVDQLLASSITVYGLRDQRSPRIGMAGWIGGEKGAIAAYFAAQTGGSYLSVGSAQYGEGMERILSELHGRYELGFTPPSLDGKRHHLRVALSPAARKRYPKTRLEFRSGYLARGAANP